MRSFKHIILSVFLGSAALLMLPQSSGAAATTNKCQFGDQIKALSAAQKNSASGRRDDLLAELELRKTILKNTLDCALMDAQKLKATAQSLPEDDPALVPLKKLYLNRLDEALSYYSTQRGRISDLGLQGSKDLARNIGEWRSGNYGPLADTIGNLVLWIKNQSLFPTAENRYAQVDKNLKGLNLNEESEVQTLLNQARADLTAAEDLNVRAKTALVTHEKPDETGTLLKQSLDKLSATYQDFFDITQAVKKIVPL